MADLRDAARQALEALESLFTLQADDARPKRCGDAITALRAALAEPVACNACVWQYYMEHGLPIGTKLYTHPPRREWRGLSKDESLKLWGMRSDGPSNTEITSYARAIEAALKERNA